MLENVVKFRVYWQPRQRGQAGYLLQASIEENARDDDDASLPHHRHRHHHRHHRHHDCDIDYDVIVSVDSYVVHWRARGQQTWDTRTILVPPVDRPTTEKVNKIS